jgi:3-phenylpropionate/cinnamic acid dioxygenase small subunit
MTTTMGPVEAEQFLFREARLLDAGDRRSWQELTTDDVVYWVPVNDAESLPDEHLSIVFDDRRRLDTRIWRVAESGLNHAQDPQSSTVRFISNVEVEGADVGDEVVVRCNMLLYEYRSGGQRRNIAPHAHPARCEYRLRQGSDGWKIAYKKVTFLMLDAPLPSMNFLI